MAGHTYYLAFLWGACSLRARGHKAWSRHHGFSGKLPGDRPCHFEPLHPYRQLCYLAPGLLDIVHHVRLPRQRSHQRVCSRPTADPVSYQAGGNAELSGPGRKVGHGQHDHNLPRANTPGLQREEKHNGLSKTQDSPLYIPDTFLYILFFLHFLIFLWNNAWIWPTQDQTWTVRRNDICWCL